MEDELEIGSTLRRSKSGEQIDNCTYKNKQNPEVSIHKKRYNGRNKKKRANK